MDVVLGFPFRPEGIRQAIFDKVRPIVQDMFPFTECVTMDSGHPIFNRSGSRNQIANYAMSVRADVVVICDADSIPNPEVLKETIHECYDKGEVRIPFDTVQVIRSRQFLHHGSNYSTIRPIRKYGPSCGGIFVIRPLTWRSIGGMDERVTGWGSEDQIFLSAVNTLMGGPVFHVGDLINVEHPRDMKPQSDPRNLELVAQYHTVEGNHNELRRIQRGSNSLCPDPGQAQKPS